MACGFCPIGYSCQGATSIISSFRPPPNTVNNWLVSGPCSGKLNGCNEAHFGPAGCAESRPAAHGPFAACPLSGGHHAEAAVPAKRHPNGSYAPQPDILEMIKFTLMRPIITCKMPWTYRRPADLRRVSHTLPAVPERQSRRQEQADSKRPLAGTLGLRHLRRIPSGDDQR
jgi:hypothetical protein